MRPTFPCPQSLVPICLALALPGIATPADAQSPAPPILPETTRPAALSATAATATPPRHQNGTNTPAAATISSLTLLVDGRLTPERISDQVACRHFISVTALRSDASMADTQRLDAILRAVGLSAPDRDNYVRALATVRDTLQDIDQRMLAAHADLSALDLLKQQRGLAMDNAMARVQSSLSADGAALLRKHLNERVKTRIRIYGNAK